jgi:hypothetical protein
MTTKTQAITEATFDTYETVYNELAATARKSVDKWLAARTVNLGLRAERDANGNYFSIASVGEDWLWETLAAMDLFPVSNEDDIEYVTLGQLAESRATERDVAQLQFDINPSNVAKILTDKENGLVRDGKLIQPIAVGFLPDSDDFVIVSGRHRSAALLTIAGSIEGSDKFLWPVVVHRPKTMRELAQLVSTYNGSRNMTATEKASVHATSHGYELSPFMSVEEVMASLSKVTSLAELRKVIRPAGVAFLRETPAAKGEYSTTLGSLGDIAYGIINGFAKRLDNVYPKTSHVLFRKDEDGHTLVSVVLREACEWVAANWQTLREEAREIKTNKDGSEMVSYNVARNKKAIIDFVVETLVTGYSENLVALRKQDEQSLAQAKSEKAQDKALAEAVNQLTTLEKTREFLVNSGLPTESIDAGIAKQAAIVDAMKAGNAQQVAEEQEGEKDQLAALLS